MRRFRRILVGIDFSPASKAALKAALRLADFDQAAVTLVHIVDVDLANELRRVNGWDDAEVLQEAKERVHRFLGGPESPADLPRLHLEVNHPFLGLMSACRCRDADLLVLGTRGIQHHANQVGAVAAKCARRAPADVLLVREDAQERFRKALVCIDFSETSARALQAAGYLAQSDGTELDCVFVYRPPLQMALAMEYGGSVPELPDWQACLDAWKADLDQFVAGVLKPFEAIRWRTEVLTGGHIREALIRYAGDTDADMVILGTRGKTNLTTLLIGTTAESVVRHATCSILAVKPAEFLPPHTPFEPPPHEYLRSNQATRILP